MNRLKVEVQARVAKLTMEGGEVVSFYQETKGFITTVKNRLGTLTTSLQAVETALGQMQTIIAAA